MSEEKNPRSSCKIFDKDVEFIHKFRAELIKAHKCNVTFPEAVHEIIQHYFELCQTKNLREEAIEVIKNVKNIEEESK